jgi:hypothetical protein
MSPPYRWDWNIQNKKEEKERERERKSHTIEYFRIKFFNRALSMY